MSFLSRRLINFVLLGALYHCQFLKETPNLFNPANNPVWALLPNANASSQVQPLVFSLTAKDKDIPTFVYSQVLDLGLSAPKTAVWNPGNFRFNGTSPGSIEVRDIIQINETTIRLLLNIDSSKPLVPKFSLIIDRLFADQDNTRLIEFNLFQSFNSGQLIEARSFMESKVINEKFVLLVGGIRSNNTTSNLVELFNSEDSTSVEIGRLPEGLHQFRLTKVNDSILIVTGGETNPDPVSITDSQFSEKVHLIHLENRTITTLPFDLQTKRSRHTDILLDENRILISGGRFKSGTSIASFLSNHEIIYWKENRSELLPPAANFIDSNGNSLPRFGHTALLKGNQVSFFLGRNRLEETASSYLTDRQLLDLNQNQMTRQETNVSPRFEFSLLEFPKRDPILLGGFNGFPNLLLQSYSTPKGLSDLGFFERGRIQSSFASNLNESLVLAFGGMDLAVPSPSIEAFVLSDNRSYTIGNLKEPRRGHSTYRIGEKFFTFGNRDFPTRNVEVFRAP